jgi:hypothetical protein
MKKKAILLSLASFLSFSAVAQDAPPKLAQLTDSGVFLTEGPSGSGALALASCQPLKGEKVVILDVQQNAMGVTGATAARVRVTEGGCTGQEGWVGVAHLASAQ